jgi:hypothetical protein
LQKQKLIKTVKSCGEDWVTVADELLEFGVTESECKDQWKYGFSRTNEVSDIHLFV